MLLCEGDQIRVADIPLEPAAPRPTPDPVKAPPGEPAALDAAIRTYVEGALAHFHGNRSRTARALRITRQRLRRILHSDVD
jgi:DNA-binding NtrC family response regulator